MAPTPVPEKSVCTMKGLLKSGLHSMDLVVRAVSKFRKASSAAVYTVFSPLAFHGQVCEEGMPLRRKE